MSTRSVSTATAIVFTDADAVTDGLPTEVATTVAVLVASLAVPAGTSTLTQMFVVAPEATVGVVASGVVHVPSKKLTGKVPPVDVIVYESLLKPRFLSVTV